MGAAAAREAPAAAGEGARAARRGGAQRRGAAGLGAPSTALKLQDDASYWQHLGWGRHTTTFFEALLFSTAENYPGGDLAYRALPVCGPGVGGWASLVPSQNVLQPAGRAPALPPTGQVAPTLIVNGCQGSCSYALSLLPSQP